MADEMKHNTANAKLCLSYSLAKENLLLDDSDDHRDAFEVDGPVGTVEFVYHIFSMP